MFDFLQRNQTAALIVGMTAASLLTALIFAGVAGGAGALSQLFTWANMPKLLTALAIVVAGALTSFLAMRLALVYANVNATAEGPAVAPQQLRLLRIVATPAIVEQGRTAQQALDELDAMIGLNSVKAEVNTLIARLQLEQKRRAEGKKVTGLSQHMVFQGPPGVGKTVVAHALGDIYRGLGVLKRGHLIVAETKDLIKGYIGQTAGNVDKICESALDGILFIDEAYGLVAENNTASFGMDAINTLLTFMENYRDRVIVIVAGYSQPMQKFLDANPGLRGRFAKTIEFPDYAPDELAQIMIAMVKAQDFVPPENYEEKFNAWVSAARGRIGWANARSVRQLVEKMREAQAVRLSRDPESSSTSQLTLADLDSAIAAY